MRVVDCGARPDVRITTRAKTAPRIAWAEWLPTVRTWTHCLHLTCRRSDERRQVEKAARACLNRVNRIAYGCRAWRAPARRGIRWVLFLEHNSAESWHAHVLLDGLPAGREWAILREVADWWHERYGFCRPQRIRDLRRLCLYLCKQVTPENTPQIGPGFLSMRDESPP